MPPAHPVLLCGEHGSVGVWESGRAEPDTVA